MEIERILLSQRDFFKTQQTKSLAFRKMYLEKLKNLIISNSVNYQLPHPLLSVHNEQTIIPKLLGIHFS